MGILFSGYGEQFVTMGKDLYDHSRHVQDLFEQASLCLSINFVQLCFASSDAEISDIEKGYVAILLFQISLYSQLSQMGFKPDFIAGYGIGEYAAAVACGSLSFADGLYLLGKYAKNFKAFLHEHPEYAVLSLPRGFTKASLEALCAELSGTGHDVFIAAHTTESGFYVAGHQQVIENIKEYCKKHDIRKVKELSAAYGVHNQLLDSVIPMVSPYLFKVDFKPLKSPVITNVDGVYVTSPDALESAIVRQINNPIVWDEVMDGFIGCEILVCFGPGKQIAEWAQLKYPEKQIYLIQTLADLQNLQHLLQQEDSIVRENLENQGAIAFGTCHIDDDIIPVSEDLTIADQINELSTDYDIEDDEDIA